MAKDIGDLERALMNIPSRDTDRLIYALANADFNPRERAARNESPTKSWEFSKDISGIKHDVRDEAEDATNPYWEDARKLVDNYNKKVLKKIDYGANAAQDIPSSVKDALEIHPYAAAMAEVWKRVGGPNKEGFRAEEFEGANPEEIMGSLIHHGSRAIREYHRQNYESEKEHPLKSFQGEAKHLAKRLALRRRAVNADDSPEMLAHLLDEAVAHNHEPVAEYLEQRARNLDTGQRQVERLREQYGDRVARAFQKQTSLF